MKKHLIASFYKFVELESHESLKPDLLQFMQDNHILGTVILASEGINGSVAGTPAQVHAFYQYIRAMAPFDDLFFRETFDNLMPFEKAKVKLRKEIVTLGVPGVDPVKNTGTKVTPEEWNTLIEDPDVVLVDTRNDYEVVIGTFKNAANPDTENFRDFPEYVRKNLMDKKDKKIAMFCTGGIRCEKSTAYLQSLGFNDVYQLDGGILNYMERIPAEKSLWEGSCFVFDDRIAIDTLG